MVSHIHIILNEEIVVQIMNYFTAANDPIYFFLFWKKLAIGSWSARRRVHHHLVQGNLLLPLMVAVDSWFLCRLLDEKQTSLAKGQSIVVRHRAMFLIFLTTWTSFCATTPSVVHGTSQHNDPRPVMHCNTIPEVQKLWLLLHRVARICSTSNRNVGEWEIEESHEGVFCWSLFMLWLAAVSYKTITQRILKHKGTQKTRRSIR